MIFSNVCGKCQVKPLRRGMASTLPYILCCSMYCLFCEVLCVVYLNVYSNTETECLGNCSYQIYQKRLLDRGTKIRKLSFVHVT